MKMFKGKKKRKKMDSSYVNSQIRTAALGNELHEI